MINNIEELKEIARKIRYLIIEMLAEAGSGHPGGSLSIVEIITALYFNIMKHKPEAPDWQDRDRCVLSKGHGCPALYAALALSGYFPMEELKKLRKLGSMLQGHPDRLFTPGVEVSSGSLGQSLSIAGGIALAGKLDKKDYYVYVILGDGELQEGQIWEAAMAAAHYKLSNLISFVDYNKYQIDGKIEEVINIEPLEDKWRAFGWYTTSIDGHDITQILDTTKKIKAEVKDKPSVIIAHTIKGKGVSFMENQNKYHGVAPTLEEEKRALVEIGNFVAV